MPRVVDAGARKSEIADAALRLARNQGLAAVTFRNIAREMGARSTTVVSHYAPSRRALVELMFDRLSEVDAHVSTGSAASSPEAALARLAESLLPTTPETRLVAQLRLDAAVAFPDEEQGDGLLAGWGLVDRRDLEGLVRRIRPAVGALAVTDALVAGLNGIALHGLVDTQRWDAARQRLALHTLLGSLGLTQPAPA